MIKDFRIRNNRILTHFAFWLLYLVAIGFAWGYCFDHTNYFLPAYESKAIELPVIILAAYTNMYILLPNLFVRKKYFSYLLALIISLVIVSFFIRLIQVYYLNVKYPASWDKNELYEPYYYGRIIILSIIPALIVTTIIKLLQYWYSEQKKATDLLQEKMAAELGYLKGQVHPHFLFNTLNNLYSLTLSKSDYAPKVVLKLAALMSYTLYDSRSDKILLNKEIASISDYIDLERIRYGKNIDISFNVYGNTERIYIPPLILIPFIENAFKHGASTETKNSWITIDLKVKENSLAVKVENSKNGTMITNDMFGYRNGIGLENVKRRLALLYPGKYHLSIEDNKEHYAVDLKLILSENKPV